MLTKLDNEFLWCEKYRPQKIEDCVLLPSIKKNLLTAVKNREMQNMLFSGGAGCGKTTSAKAICKMLDIDYLFINASEDNGIDVLRNRIRQFASSMSLSGGCKVVILDEADHLTNNVQVALRGFIEEFSSNCRFILTCNFKNKIIEPLHSRLTSVDFTMSKKDLAKLAGEFMKRMQKLLDGESIKYEEKTLAEIIIKYAPDWRRVINECQKHSIDGVLNSVALVGAADEEIAELVKLLKAKDFKNMRAWVANNTTLDGVAIFQKLYDQAYTYMKPETIPNAVLILAEYSYKSGFMADKELNVVAAMTELMGSVTWN